MEDAVRQLSLTCLLVGVIFTQAASAQLQGGMMGEVKNSIGGLDNSVHAEVEPSRPASSSRKGGPPTAAGSKWNLKPEPVSVGARSDGSEGEGIASWSPTRNGAQTTKFRPGAALSSGPMFSSVGSRSEKTPAEAAKSAETARKTKGIKPVFPPAGTGGPELQSELFARREFTGKVHYAYGSSKKARRQAREKIAKQLKGSGSPAMVGKRKEHASSAKLNREFQAQEGRQECDDASKLVLCTWFSGK